MILTAKLSEQLIIKELTTSATTWGETVEIYRPAQIVYASIINQNGNTTFNAPGKVYNDSISFYMRYLRITDKKKYRIEYQNNDYEISAINTVGRNQATVMTCTGVR